MSNIISTDNIENIERNYQEMAKTKHYKTRSTMRAAEQHQFGKQQYYTIPKNENQEVYCRLLDDSTKKIVIATGAAGTGKTLFATEIGIRSLLAGDYDKLIFTRPAVCVDENLGFLKGSLEEKMSPYTRPIFDILYNYFTAREVMEMIEEKVIEIVPLGYMRGRTFKNSWIIADEIQNTTIAQMKMLLTRIGESSKMVITGDLHQTDRMSGIPKGEVNGLADFLDKLKTRRSDSISNVEFANEDIEREKVVKDVLEIYGLSLLCNE
jgi:phosphate starvation-inducible PhoH-like protein